MKNSLLRRGLCVLTLSMAGTALAGDNTPPPAPPTPPTGTLFNANELGVSIFGDGQFGDDHLGTYQRPVYSAHAVAAPGTPAAGVITVAIRRPGFRSAVSLKPLALPATVATGGAATTSAPSTTRRIVQPTHVEHDAGGGGVEVSWFFTRYFGVAIEGDFLAGNPYVTELSGQFIARYPFEFAPKPATGYSKDDKAVRPPTGGKDYKDTEVATPTWGIAPYVLVGGGSQWDGRAVGLFDVGGGAELRFAKHWGVFSDVRWYFRDSSQHFTAVRAGVDYQF